MKYYANIVIGNCNWEGQVETETRSKAYNRAAHKFNKEKGSNIPISFLVTRVSVKALVNNKKPLVIPKEF